MQLEIIRFLHTVAGFPMKATWTKAIKVGNHATRQGLMIKAVQKYFPESEETTKGHGRKMKAGLRSMKVKMKDKGEPVGNMGVHSNKAKKKEIFMKLVDVEDELHKKIFSDQTDVFLF